MSIRIGVVVLSISEACVRDESGSTGDIYFGLQVS